MSLMIEKDWIQKNKVRSEIRRCGERGIISKIQAEQVILSMGL